MAELCLSSPAANHNQFQFRTATVPPSTSIRVLRWVAMTSLPHKGTKAEQLQVTTCIHYLQRASTSRIIGVPLFFWLPKVPAFGWAA